MTLQLQPIAYADACAFITAHHRHHLPPQGWKFGIGLNDGVQLVGVVTVGRPVARHLDNGWTLEVTRCCTDGTEHACSKLYAAAWRATRALGYRRLITYTLASESGASLRGAGWQVLYQTPGGEWGRLSRPREITAPTVAKTLWEASS